MSYSDHDKGLEHLEMMRLKRKCLELRLASWSYRAIADEVGRSIETVRSYVQEMTVISLPKEETDLLRQHEVAKIDDSERRLNSLLALLHQQAVNIVAENGNLAEVTTQIRNTEESLSSLRRQRALLLGLNVPVQVAHTHKIRTEFDQEIEALVAQLSGGGKVMSLPEDVLDNE